ncbi:hypothetical protein RB594_002026 [Gaeumannomyces avenae]
MVAITNLSGLWVAAVLTSTTALVRAAIPSNSGYSVIWSDDFEGSSGSAVSSSKWDVMQRSSDDNSNGEWQEYRASTANARLSGDGSLLITPRRDASAKRGWTSARLTSKGSWQCPRGAAVIFQAEVLVPNFTGSPDNFAGLWPAFWARGTTVPDWPRRGEWDVLEPTNRLSNVNQGTLHYQTAQGQYASKSGRVTYKGGDWHTWAIKSDRRNSNWREQKLTWYLDGKAFVDLSGADFAAESEWRSVAWNPFEIILNVAVGGGYPGDPTSATLDGLSAAMRVRYVAIYQSN